MAEKAKGPALQADPMKERPDRADGEMLPSELVRVQQEAAQPKPEPVPLKRRKGGGDDGEVGPPVAVAVPARPAPRVVHENARAQAGSGVSRFKVRCLNYGESQPWRYVLAASEEEARGEYLRHTGLAAVVAAVGEGAPAPRLAVKRLPD